MWCVGSAIVVLAALVATAAPAEAAGGQWLGRAALTTARQEVSAARLGDRVYVVGGLAGPPLTALASMEVYDVLLDTWSAGAPLPVARDHMGVAALDGEIYVVGGFAGDFAARSETFIYDPGLNAWRAGVALPAPRGGLWMVAYGGRLYAFGGVDAADQATRSVFVYDPVAASWSMGADMPTAREHLNAVVAGSFLYVLGGRGGSATAANERYDPATDTWTVLAPMPTARSAAAAAALGGRIWVAGGEVPQLFAVNEVYDVASDQWCRDTPMALPRHGVAAVALDDRILVPAGGVVQGLQATAAVDVFVPGDEPVFRTVPACPAAPTVCRQPVAARTSAVALSTRPPDGRRNRLVWQWGRGAATDLGDFGNPLAGDGLAICLYDGSGLRSALRVPGESPACGAPTKPRWRPARRGFTYADRTLAADGVERVALQSGADGKARLAVAAKGPRLVLPSLATLTSPVTLQLRSATGACWSARFSFPPAVRRTAMRFSDRAD